MRGAVILLPVAILFLGVCDMSQGTICTKVSGWTCQKSLYATGRCVNGVCECVSSEYTPGPFGCQKKPKSELTPGTGFTGDVQTGASVFLECTMTLDEVKWFKDGRHYKTLDSYFINLENVTLDMSGSYTCQSNPSGISSDVSDPFYVNVADTFKTKLEVSGMPTKIVEDTTIRFDCKTGPVYASQNFSWIYDGHTLQGETDSSYIRTVTTQDAGKTLRCALPNAVGSDTSVVFPSQFASDIAGVVIEPKSPTTLMDGDMLQLDCIQTGGFPQPYWSDKTVTYAWRKNGQILEYQSSSFMYFYTSVEDSGIYTCEASVGTHSSKVSQPVKVEIKKILGYKSMDTSSFRQLDKGYYRMTCEYHTINASIPVTYSWFMYYTELQGVTDKTLQLNQPHPSSTFDSTYTCKVTCADGTLKSGGVRVWFQDTSVIEHDYPFIRQPPSVGVGIPITFTCQTLFATPGMDFYWNVDGMRQFGHAENTFVYTPTHDGSVIVGCQYYFAGVTSRTGSIEVKPQSIFSVDVKVNDLNVTSFQPVAGTVVKFTCDVSKSSGVGPVAYQWKLGASVISGEVSQFYSTHVGEVGSASQVISCVASIGSVAVTSPQVTVSPSEFPEIPIVAMTSDHGFKREAPVVMKCLSTSHAQGASFDWMKDGHVIGAVKSYKYVISHVSKTDEGRYTCKIKVDGKTSDESGAATLKTQPNEKTCQWADDCIDPNMDSTICYQGKYCHCLYGYTMKGGQCVFPFKLQGKDPKPAALPSGNLEPVIFQAEITN